MITANTTVAAPTPASAERQPRVTPTARTIVSASTISTALARNAARNKNTALIHLRSCRISREQRLNTAFRRRSGGLHQSRGVQVRRIAHAAAFLCAAVGLAGCVGSSTSRSTTSSLTTAMAPSTTRPPTKAAATVTTTQAPPPGALQAEANSAATGDIPDNQVF